MVGKLAELASLSKHKLTLSVERSRRVLASVAEQPKGSCLTPGCFARVANEVSSGIGLKRAKASPGVSYEPLVRGLLERHLLLFGLLYDPKGQEFKNTRAMLFLLGQGFHKQIQQIMKTSGLKLCFLFHVQNSLEFEFK